LFFQYSYANDETDTSTSLIDQSSQWYWPLPVDRFIRTTKFPRIGRSFADNKDYPTLFDDSTTISNQEDNHNDNYDDDDDDDDDVVVVDNNDDDRLRMIQERSVLFPRIGKRAFHNLLWANARTNPHRTLDAQGRSHLSSYDHYVHPVAVSTSSRHRGKRNIPVRLFV
jgi:hypothetical protein